MTTYFKLKNMRTIILIFISLFSVQLNAQTDYKGKLSVPFLEYDETLEVSYGINVYQTLFGDSIVLKDKYEYFSTIHVYSGNTLVFEFKDGDDSLDYEIDVFDEGICVIHEDLYIFKVNRRRPPDGYLIFRRDGNTITKVGYTGTCSAYIFGDIDGDGKFEIGGFKYLFEVDVDRYGSRDEVYKERFRIYKINDGITRDTDLEERFSKAVMSRFDFPHSGITESLILTSPMNVNEIKEESLRRYAGLSAYKLWDGSLDGISKDELRLMRNEIFAAHGHIFRSEDLNEYFSKQLWYKPCCTDVTDKLNEVEKYNINFIKSQESTR
ncbi:MAG TPA: YARHG domain-containing protein [Chloroflexi bacterium]|nr:YARHG domain-containing protein [Chloroflexota bacterium]